ncbi:MAG: DNA recombination protein RmuC [Coprobacillus sp.]|nr:DNA recombination protein RmuC [Coprobacillus sp.]
MSGTDIFLIVIGVILVVAIIVLITLLIVRFTRRKNDETTQGNSEIDNKTLLDFKDSISGELNNRFKEMNERLEKNQESINETVNKQLNEMDVKLDRKLGESSEKTENRLKEVNETVQKVIETQKTLDETTKDVVDLKVVLEGNQTRGQYGEMQLSSILQRYFHEPSEGTYLEQYKMPKAKDGSDVRADAVVFLPNNLYVCVDSKFPFQDYQRMFENKEEEEKYKNDFMRAVKKHIKDISDKYILEGETFPQAIMFIPNDGIDAFIHYELPDVVDYAYSLNVILASPRVLGPLLTEIRMLKQEEKRNKLAKQLTVELNKLGTQFRLFSNEWSTFSNRIEGLHNDAGKISKRTENITKNFDKIKEGELGIIDNSEIPEIEETTPSVEIDSE